MRPRLLVVLALILTVQVAAADVLSNRLKQHPSPYLAMHGDDPVAWQEWWGAIIPSMIQPTRAIAQSDRHERLAGTPAT